MFKINEYVVYKKDVCQIKDIIERNDRKYYVMIPINDHSLKIEALYENENKWIRKILSKKDIEIIINKIPSIPLIDMNNTKQLENEYKRMLYDGTHEDLISIIKTSFLRNKNRIDNKKKIGEIDDNYFQKAESLLYNEFSIALNMSYDDTKEYVRKKVEELSE